MEDDSDSEDAMHLDAPMSDDGEESGAEGGEENAMDMDEDAAPVPMPESGGIQALREKLHARMAALRQKGKGRSTGDEPGSRDELLEERRKQRAAMRERRRKETKEKIRREEERKGKGKDKGKEKEKQQQQKGPQTKVRIRISDVSSSQLPDLHLPFVRDIDPATRTRHRQAHTPRPKLKIHLRHLRLLGLRRRVLLTSQSEGQEEPAHDRVKSRAGTLAARRTQGEARGFARGGARRTRGAGEVGQGRCACRGREGARRRGAAQEGGKAQGEAEAEEQEDLVRFLSSLFVASLVADPFAHHPGTSGRSRYLRRWPHGRRSGQTILLRVQSGKTTNARAFVRSRRTRGGQGSRASPSGRANRQARRRTGGRSERECAADRLYCLLQSCRRHTICSIHLLHRTTRVTSLCPHEEYCTLISD